jgi:tetratricopeptide (TPR) repeat protein
MNRKQRRTAAKIAKKSPDASAVDNVVQKAIAAMQSGAFVDAEAALDEVLARVPNHVEALHQKGMLLARTGRAEDGLALLRRATAAKPGEALYWNNLAAACLTIDQSAEARKAAAEAVRLDSKYLMAWRNLGMALTDLGQHRDAAEALIRACALAPNDVEILNRLGMAQVEADDFTRAETAFTKAVALDPRNAECRSNLGVLLTKRGRTAEALPHLEKAVEIDPERFTAALYFGIALALAGDHAKGLRWLRRATSIQPRSDAAWGALADAAIAAGERQEALDAARRAAAIAPSDQAHQTRLQKLQPSDVQPRATLVELDLGEPLSATDRGQAAETDLSTSLDQIFIR